MIDLLIDAVSLDDASAFRGIGTYVRQVLAGLAADKRFSPSALVAEGTDLPPGVQPLTVRRFVPPRFRATEHDLRLPHELDRERPQVFHSPALDPPRRSPVPWICTLHDVIPLVLDYPDLAAERKRWKRRAARYRSASSVIAVSRHTADEGIRVLELDPQRVEVIPHGVEDRFRASVGPRDADPPYILAVGEYSQRDRKSVV